ncbi:MAG: hypothetical protein ACUVTM_06060 [Candidatus Bathyarchaeia archaeon]
MIQCARCGNILVPGTNFCDSCGASATESLWRFIKNIGSQTEPFKHEKETEAKVSKPIQGKISTDDFLTLYREGLNDREIARRLNVRPSSIRLLRNKLGLSSNAPRGFPQHIIEARKEQGKRRLEELETTLKMKGPIQSDELPYSDGALMRILRGAEGRIGSVRFHVRHGSRFSEYELFGKLAGKRLLYLKGDERIIGFLAQNLNPKTKEMYRAITLKLRSSGMPDELVRQIINTAKNLHITEAKHTTL